jgi:Na+/proline symporter
MTVILAGMALAVVFIWSRLPADLTLSEAMHVAGAYGKMRVVDYSARFDTRYTFWSGLTGGLFVQLAYFGTDQSQVQRYLGGASLAETRLGLLMNGIVKIPMQFLILFVGILLFVFYQFHQAPLYFNQVAWQKTEHAQLDAEWTRVQTERRAAAESYLTALRANQPTDNVRAQMGDIAKRSDALRKQAKAAVTAARPGVEANDADYVFISFILAQFPAGLLGLLIAVILCAAMSATAAALSSLGQTTVVDFYRVRVERDDPHYLVAARWFTLGWSVLAVAFAAFASLLENLIQAVNILGSIFYGPMLGVFLVGFFVKPVRGTPVFLATLVAQAAVIAVFALSSIGFLWYNVIGCATVIGVSLVLQSLMPNSTPA